MDSSYFISFCYYKYSNTLVYRDISICRYIHILLYIYNIIYLNIYIDIYTRTDVFVSAGYILKIGIKGCVHFHF